MFTADQIPSSKAWFMWGLAITFLLLQFILQGSVSGMAPFLAKDFHTDVAAVGLISSSYFWTYLLLQMPGGMLVDRLGAKRLLIAGTLICAAGTFCFAMSHSINAAVWARMLTGLGTAPALACGFYLIGSWFTPAYFAFVVGLSEALAMLFGGVGSEIISAAASHFGWRPVLLCAVIICLIMAVLMSLFLQDRPVKTHHHTNPKSILTVKQQLMAILGLPQVWLNGLFSGLMFPMISLLATYWCIPYLMARYGINIRLAALGNLAIFLGAGLGCPFLGHLSDFFRRRKVVMAIGALSAFITMSMALYIPHLRFSTVVTLFFLTGTFASVYVLPFALVNEVVPEEARGTAMGFTNMLSIIFGAPLFMPLVGLLLKYQTVAASDVTNFPASSYTMALSILPISFLLALVVLAWIREPVREHTLRIDSKELL
ncbi:MAG: major facilitator family transporter [Gammaproteobacteria bacterium]|jgi:MFS family permease|nr:major facilitator family transporter [Gammaproteobacteria bacterium]